MTKPLQKSLHSDKFYEHEKMFDANQLYLQLQIILGSVFLVCFVCYHYNKFIFIYLFIIYYLFTYFYLLSNYFFWCISFINLLISFTIFISYLLFHISYLFIYLFIYLSFIQHFSQYLQFRDTTWMINNRAPSLFFAHFRKPTNIIRITS